MPDPTDGPSSSFSYPVSGEEALRWAAGVAKDDSFWFTPAFDQFPAPIAHEYFRLREVLSQGQIYGALLQIKDTFEVLIKFSVCALVSESLAANEPIAETGRGILREFLHKIPALGHWAGALERIRKDKAARGLRTYPLVAPLGGLGKIVEWRNDRIGHGAARFADEETFQKELEEQIVRLKCYFKKLSTVYDRWRLSWEQGDLSGHESMQTIHSKGDGSHPEETGHVFLGCKDDGNSVGLYPLLRLQTCRECGYRDLFFFDSRKASVVLHN